MTNIEQEIDNLRRIIKSTKASIEEMTEEGIDEELIDIERMFLESSEERLNELLSKDSI